METMPDKINQELNTDASESEARLAKKKAEFEAKTKKGANANDSETAPEAQTPEPEFSEKDFTPEDWGKVNELAFFIYEYRMLDANDPATIKEQEKWAKEYGLPKDIFTKKSIREILSSAKVNGQNINEWTPEAKHFMHNWDLKTAIDVYSQKKKDWEQKKKTLSEENDERIRDVFGNTRGTQMQNESDKNELEKNETESVANTAAAPAAETLDEEDKKTELAKLYAEVEKMRIEYKNTRARFEENRSIWRKVLDLGVEKSPDVAVARKKWQDAIGKYNDAALTPLFEKMEKAGNDDERNATRKEIENFSLYMRGKEALEVHDETNKQIVKNFEKRKWWSRNITGRYSAMTKYFTELPLKYRIPITLALAGGGTAIALAGVAGLSFASPGLAAISVFKIGRRIFGGGVAQAGAEVALKKRKEKKFEKIAGEDVAELMAILDDKDLTYEQKLAAFKSELNGEKIGQHVAKLRNSQTIRKVLSRAFGGSISAFGFFMDIKQSFAETAIAAKEAVKGGKDLAKGAVIEHIAQKNESALGILRRAMMENSHAINTDGSLNFSDPAVNDYFLHLKKIGKIPKGLKNLSDISGMDVEQQAQFTKLLSKRLDWYYSGLRETIEQKMASDPGYYHSLSSEMRNLADNLDNYRSYKDLPAELKKVVFGDRMAANMYLNKYHSLGEAVNLKAGNTVNVFQNPQGRFDFDILGGNEDIAKESIKTVRKTGAEALGRGGGGGAVETVSNVAPVKSATKILETSAQAPKTPGMTPGMTPQALHQDNIARLASEQVLNEQAILGATKANAQLWNMWLKDGVGNGFRLQDRAIDVWEGIKNLSGEITSDQPQAATVDNILSREKAVGFTQELFNTFPINGNETMGQYIQRLSSRNFHLFNRIRNNYHL